MTGHVVLVTGGNRGIGHAIAKRFAAAGHQVAITSRSGTADDADDLLVVQADVTDTESVDAAVSEIEEKLGPVQVLVSNAGITKDGLVLRMSDDDFIDVLDAGHYSFLNICGMLDQFGTGCGEDQRQTDPAEVFSYLSPTRARALTATYAVAFFSWTLKEDERGRELLAEEIDDAVLGPEFTPALGG